MQLKKVSSAFLIALLTSIAVPLMVNLSVISVPLEVLAETKYSRKQEADRLLNQGSKNWYSSQYKAALQSYQQALKIYRNIKDRRGEGRALNGLGWAYTSLGNQKQAIEYFQQSLSITRDLGDKAVEVNSLGGLGYAYNSLGDYKKAINYYQQSLKIARSIGDQQGESKSLGGLGYVYNSLGDYKKAINYHQQSLKIARSIGDQYWEGASLGHLGNAYHSLGDYKKAINYYQQSLSIARSIGDRNGEGNSLNNLGLAYLDSGQPKQAEKHLRNAIQVLESQRSLLGNNHTLKVSFFDTQAKTYRLLQQTLIAQKQNHKALEIAERGRARAFTELIIEKQKLKSSLPPNIQQIRSVAKEQNATIVYYSIASNDLYIWVIKPTGKIAFEKVDLKDKRLGDFAEDARTAAATIGEGRSLQRSLANDLITGLVRKTRSAASKTGDNPSTPSPTDQVVRRLGCRGNVCLQQMYNLLIQPIADKLPTNPEERVIFVPHESLFLVPFAALQDKKDKKFLIEKHTISIAPSIQVLQLTRDKKLGLKSQSSNSSNSMVVVGNPTMPKVNIYVEPEQLDSLPEAEKEAIEIAKMFNTQALTGNQAT
ncbi:CHAT domain-containing protein, partial [Calothrix rhizosoleniae]|uniref:CHAT domain-containing protein n=1 Tax=Calothrix rhizosoleniae TaxID=888997 RepID=UPI000B499849